MDVRVLSTVVECKHDGILSEQILRNPVTKNGNLAVISRAEEQSKPTSLTVLANNLVINSAAVLGDEDYNSGSNSSYKDIAQAPVTPGSDQSELEKTPFSEQHTGKEHCDTIDGIKFLTFETEYDLNEFTKVKEFKDSEENNESDDGLFLDDTLKPDQDIGQGIVLRKTRNIKKVKGWRNKMFAGHENCSRDKRTVELDDGFESSDIKVEPGTSTEKCESLVNWFEGVSNQTNSYDSNKVIKEEIDDSIDVGSVSDMDNLMDWKESRVPELLPKAPEEVPNKSLSNNSAFYSHRLNVYMKHAQLSCGLPDTDEQEPHRDSSYDYSVSSISNDLPKVASPRIGPKAKTLAEKRRLMNLEHKRIDAIKCHRHIRLKNIALSKHTVSKTSTPQLSRDAVIANLDANYKYVWVQGSPIKIVGSKGALNTKRKIRKPTPQPRTACGPLGRNRLHETNSHGETSHVKLSAVSKASNSPSEMSSPKATPVPTNSKLTKQTSHERTPAVDFRAKLRPRKISIIPPTAANHSDFYDRLPISSKTKTPALSKPSHFNDEPEQFVYGIAVYPEINRPLEVLPTAHLESLRHNQKEINDDWIKFATSVVTSIKSPISPAKKIVLIVSQLQEPNETPHLIPAKISSFKYAKSTMATQAKKIEHLLNKSVLDSPTLCPDKNMSGKLKYSYDIASLAEDMIDYIELKEELALVPIRYDPDDDRIVNKSSPAKKKVPGKRKGSALDHELRRLNVNIIDVDEVTEVGSQLADIKCAQDFCLFGCVCSSISATNHAMINHCRQINCIFQCVCSTEAQAEDFSTFSPTTVSKIQESTRYLARLEKEFQQTVVRGNDEMFVVKCSNGRHKREIKLPERYRNGDIQLSSDFEMAETKMMSVNNTEPSVKPISCPDKTCSMVEKLSKQKNFVEFIPKHTAKNLLKHPLSIRKKKKIENMVHYYEENGVIKPSHVLMFRARGLEDVKVLCMDHLLYECPCDIHPRMMNRINMKSVPTPSSSPSYTEKISSYEESIYNASTIPDSIGDCSSDTPQVSIPLGVKVRCVALKSTTARLKQMKRQAKAASRLLSSNRPSIGSTEDLTIASSQVKPFSDASEASPSTSNPAKILAEVVQSKSSTSNRTNASVDMSEEASSPPNIPGAVTQTTLKSLPVTTARMQRISLEEDASSPPRELDPEQSLLCLETLPLPEGILENLTGPSILSVRNNSTKNTPEAPPKPLPLPRWENPSQKAMINHSKRLQEVLSRRHEEIQEQIFEGDHQLDLNSRMTDALQLVKWSMLRKRFEDYTLQFWVTTHNNLSCPRLLVTERKNELPNAMCENLRAWHHDRWDDLPPLAIDLVTKTPQNVHNDLYGLLYYDGTNWELCKQVKRRESQTKKAHTSGDLQNEQPQYKYNLLLPKFKVPVRWYTISFDMKYDFLLLEKRIKVPYVHLHSMSEKSAQCGNPCRYSELSSLPKRYIFEKQFGFYADPHHPGVVFLGPFKYTESCDVRMMVYNGHSPGSFYEVKHKKPMPEYSWWYATNNTEKTVTLKNLAPSQPSSNSMASQFESKVNKNLAPPQTTFNSMASQVETEVNKNLAPPQPSFNSMANQVETEVNKNLTPPQPSFNSMASQDETEVCTEEESTNMPIITSVVSLRDTPNSDWVGPSITQNDDMVPSTNVATKYRTILPNVISSLPQAVGFTKLVDINTTRQAVANSGPKFVIKRSPMTKGVLAVRLEPSLSHVGHFQANIYGCQRYQITLPDNDSRVLKDLKAANVFLNEFIQKQAEFYPPDLSLTWQPVMSTMAASSLPFNKYILERKHVITQDTIMTKEQFKLQMALNPPVIMAQVAAPAAVPRELPRQNRVLPQELRGPVHRLVKMVGSKKNFWSNVMKEIDGVYKTSKILSEEKEQLTAVKEQFIAKFNELVKTVRFIDKRTCDEAIADVHYILHHRSARDSTDANTLVAENVANNSEDEDILLVNIGDNGASVEKEDKFGIENLEGNHSRFEDSSDEDSNVIDTSKDESDDLDDENDRSVADKLVQQPSQSLSSKNRVSKVNNVTLVENTNLSVIEEVRRRRLGIPEGTDIALCDSNVNSTRMEPDVLTIHEESNMTMIPIQKNSLENTASSSGIPWTKMKPLTDVSTQRAVSVQQECQNIELLDLTGEELKVSSIRKNVQIETIELEDDDIPLMEASELQIVETLEKEAIVDLDNCIEEWPNNVEISRVSSRSNYQTGSLLASNASLDIDLDRNTNQTTSDRARYAALTRQKIVPVASGKTVSIRKLGNPCPFQYKQFCDLSSLKPGTERAMSNLHGQKMTPFPPYQFLEVPAKPSPSPLPKRVPTSVTTSSSAKNMNVHQGPMKLQSVLQPSLQTSVTSGKSALASKRQILPKVPAGSVHNQIHLMSSQPGVPSKTVSLMMKDGKMQVLQLPQLNSSSMKPVQMMFSTDSNVKFVPVPVMKSVLQSTASRNTSRTIVLPHAQSGNEQTVSSHKIEQDNVQTGLSKANESVTLKPTSRKSFMSQVCRPTNLSSSEPSAKKRCFRSINNIGPSQPQSNSTMLPDAIPLASLTKNVSATSIVQREVPKPSTSTLPTLQLINTGTKLTPVLSTIARKLPVQQSIKINGKGGYFIKNNIQLPIINEPLNMSDLKLLGSTLANTSSSPQILCVKPNVHNDSSQQPLNNSNNPQQHAGSVCFKKNATITRMFPSTDVGESSTDEEHDED